MGAATFRILFAGVTCLAVGIATADPSVTLTLDSRAAAVPIAEDFSGLSFELANILTNAQGKRTFTPENKPLINLLRTLGVKNIRLGGNMADRPSVPVPGPADIDSLFAFAKAADARVIYTLRLREGDVNQDSTLAQYILQHDDSLLDCFAIGNEPDYYKKVYPVIKDYSGYRGEWKKFADAIEAAAAGARFCGPCAGDYNDWSRRFTDDFGQSRLVKFIAQHDYPGGSSRHATNAASAREAMVSSAWLEHYEKLYGAFGSNAIAKGLSYRLEEVNNYSDGGATNASDAFASALWSLEYLHWWAAHGANGVNIHGRRGVRNAPLRPLPANAGWNINPIGYGILAFNLGGHGSVMPLTMDNPDAVNLTAYAVRGKDFIYVTILDKTGFPGGRDAHVTIKFNQSYGDASVLFMSGVGGLAAKSGVTLGGASVNNDGSWQGQWQPLASGPYRVNVPAASAAIVKISLTRHE